MYPNIKFIYVAPSILSMPTEIIEELNAMGMEQIVTMTLEEAIPLTDVLYVTRIQKERYFRFFTAFFPGVLFFWLFDYRRNFSFLPFIMIPLPSTVRVIENQFEN